MVHPKRNPARLTTGLYSDQQLARADSLRNVEDRYDLSIKLKRALASGDGAYERVSGLSGIPVKRVRLIAGMRGDSPTQRETMLLSKAIRSL